MTLTETIITILSLKVTLYEVSAKLSSTAILQIATLVRHEFLIFS